MSFLPDIVHGPEIAKGSSIEKVAMMWFLSGNIFQSKGGGDSWVGGSK